MKRADRKKRGSTRDQRGGPNYPDVFQPSPFTEESRKKRARARRRKAMSGWPLRVLAVLALALILATLFFLLPSFTLEKVTITGTRLLDPQELSSYAEPFVGSHFIYLVNGSPLRYLTLRSGSLEKELMEAFPLLRDVDVRFRFPSEIKITAEERVEVLAVRVSGGYALVDRDHLVLRLAEDRDFGLPVLEGVSLLKEAREGSRLEVDDDSLLVNAARLMTELILHDQANAPGRQLMEEVRQFRWLAGSQYYLFIPLEQGGEIRVKLEDNRSLQEKLKILSHLLDEEEVLHQTAGELDLTGQTAYFRPDNR